MTQVSLRLFGTPRLDVDGQSEQLGRRKATALLSYLAVTRSRHHRESLATLLWPESGPEAAYSALRNVLWILRQTPLARLLRTDRSTVELVEDESLWVDVHRFRELTAGCRSRKHAGTQACADCASALEEAAALAEGPFMDGFIVSNADGFDDWQFAEREALQRELTETLDRLTAFHAEAANWTEMTKHARRWVRVDRLSEAACRRLMQGLVALGRRTEALRCYEECARTLDEELGLSPESTTSELADRIRRADGDPGERAAVPRRTNVPGPLTPFVGREEAIERVTSLVTQGEARLITLVGLGGIGKTSLALQIGRQLQDAIKDGVFFISLESVGAPEGVASTIGEALGLPHSRDKGSHRMLELQDYLRERELVLILDGVEPTDLIGEHLASLLATASNMRCLVTSRTPLNVVGETVVAIHGLDYPLETAPLDSIGEYDAIRLLRVAERRVDSAPASRDAELRAMASVARVLEGFPLGLEMAGSWRGVFSWREIAERIAANLDFLVHTHRNVPARHRNLRAVYEQAWGLLSRDERTSLGRLAVFEGGFTIEAAERATDSSPAVLAALAKRCLVRRIEPERYQLHELVRQFSLENLRAAGRDHEGAAGRHAAYFLGWVEESFEDLKGPDQLAALRSLQRDLPNIRAAWLHAARAGQVDLIRRAAHGLFFYFDMRAHFDQGARTFLGAIEGLRVGIDPVVDGLLRVAYGWFTQFTAEDEPYRWIGDGLTLLDRAKPFTVDHALGNVVACYAGAVGSRGEARERLGRSLKHYQGAGDKWGEALTIDALAGSEFVADPEEGERLAAESLRLRREIGDHWGEALNLATQARFAESREEWDLAGVRYHQSQRLSARIAEDLFMAIDAQIARARVAGRLGEHAEGERLAAEGLELARRAANRLLTARALIELGCLARGEGDWAAAKGHLEEAFALLDRTPWRILAAHCAGLLGELAEATRDDAAARRWREEQRTICPQDEGAG